MKKIDCATDIAVIGIWDREIENKTVSKENFTKLKNEAKEGRLFFINTKADGYYPIDIYVDEDIPKEVEKYFISQSKEFLLQVPSGKLKCDGVEKYAKNKRHDIQIPPGKYSLICLTCKNCEESQNSMIENELRKILPVEDIEYYDKKTKDSLKWATLLTVLVFAFSMFLAKWYVALIVSLVVFVGFFRVYEMLLEKDEKYQKLDKIIPMFRFENRQPDFVFKMKKIEHENLSGGFIEFDGFDTDD